MDGPVLGGGLGDLLAALLAALGAALVVGTGAALLHRRRTGRFPGQPDADEHGEPVAPGVGPALVKLAIGAVLLVWGVAALVTA